MRRLGVVLVVLVVLAVVLARCDTRAQFAPSMDRFVGLRADGEQLQIVTGVPCERVDRVVVLFSGGPDSKEVPRGQLTATAAVTVEELIVGSDVVVPGFTTIEALPPGFDWRDYDQVDVMLDGAAGSVGVGSGFLGPVRKQGAKHAGDGTFYVRGEGWLTSREMAAKDAKSFLTPCTPDPDGGPN